MPDRRIESDWPFPHRLPLGGGWSGTCAAPGHANVCPSEEELKSSCNIGYARHCHRLPEDRRADAVRFALGEERDGVLRVLYTFEREYLPAGHGELLYDIAVGAWLDQHGDTCLQRMAECYVEAKGKGRNSLAQAEGK